MTPDREFWRRARPFFDELVELETAEQQQRLEDIRKSDPALADTLQTLLLADASDEDPLRSYQFGPPPPEPVPAERLAMRDPLGIVGSTISRFRVVDYLAAGGMGVVYRAEDLQLGRVVALKFPLPHQHLAEEVKERFIREARAAAALDHPNLCPVYEIGESAQGFFIAMPLYAGETLKDRLDRERTLPAGEVIGIIRQVVTGLAAAHAGGIVHRDLKPGNIMLLPDRSVKILDFGLAKARDISKTKSNTTLGTLAYMAPEQVRGKEVDARADFWAVGVILYEVLTGVPPFRGDNELTILNAILHEEPNVPSQVSRGIPQPLDRLITALLQKDRSHRYASAEALLADLDAFERGSPPSHRISPWARASRQRGVRVVAFAALSVLALMATGTFAWRLARSERVSATVPLSVTHLLAVLPFVNLSPNSSDAYLVSGFADEIVSRLSKARGLRIAGLSSASALQRQGLAPRAVGDRLGATRVIDGTMRVTADTLDAYVQLTRVSDARILWSQKFRAPVSDILSLQARVADSIFRQLEPGSAPLVSLSHPLTTNPDAYKLYLQGRFAWEQRTRAKGEEALAYYRGAVDLDPGFAQAYAVMAEAYVNMQNFGFMPASEALARADIASARAIDIDTTLAEAYAARGQLLSARGSYAEAEAALRRAIDLDPSSPWAHHYYALLLTMMGRFDEAKGQLQRTLSIDPLNVPGSSTLAMLIAHEGRLHEARVLFDRAFSLSPNYVTTLCYIAAFEAAQGNYGRSARLLERARATAPNFTGERGALAFTYDKLGRAAEARRLIAEERSRVFDEGSTAKYGMALALVGKRDSAFAMLRTAKWDIPTLIDLRLHPLLKEFRSDPRYPELLARFHLKP